MVKTVFGFFLILYSLNSAKDTEPFEPLTKAELIKSKKFNSSSKIAWIFSYTGVSNEPRVIRQTKALTESGWEVVVLGYDGHSTRPNEWSFIRLPRVDIYKGDFLRALKLIEKFSYFLSLYFPGLRVIGARLYFHFISQDINCLF